MRTNRWLLGLAMSVSVVALAACGSQDDEASPKESSAAAEQSPGADSAHDQQGQQGKPNTKDIPEVVADGETGWLVPIEQVTDGTGTPVHPDTFVADLADALVRVVASCVCGSDLWPYRGVRPTPEPRRIGHELVGVVEEVGAEVVSEKPGDLGVV